MKEGWVRLYRKSVDSQVFANEHLWKLWCLCLLKANHKTEYVPIEGTVEPIKVEPGQFITGRYELHADYHQRRRGYKKRFPSPSTAWRWLLSLRDMQNLSIKSFNKYSIVTITNWEQYQVNSSGKCNFETLSQGKVQKPNIKKSQLNLDIPDTYEGKQSEDEQQMNIRRTSDEHKQECIKNDKESLPAKKKADPDMKTFILEWEEIWSKKFEKPYTTNWGKEGKLVKDMLKIHPLQELRNLRGEFFRSEDSFVRNSDYSIGIFKIQINKLIVNRKLDPVEQARKEMRDDLIKH